MYHRKVNEEKGNNEVIRRLMKMLHLPDLKVFDENLFAFFFTNKFPDKALEQYQPQASRMIRLPKVCDVQSDYPSQAAGSTFSRSILHQSYIEKIN